MSKPKLKIALADFWKVKIKGGEPCAGFLNLLRTKYDLEYSPNPDLLFCSVFTEPKNEHSRYDCMKCMINAELPQRDHGLWDYSFSVLPTDSTNFHFYMFVIAEHFQKWLHGKSNYCRKLKAHPKDRFCNFFQRYGGANVRNQFVQQLMKKKHIDCPGLAFNNMPSPDNPKLNPNQNKLQFNKHYRFTICFEHTSQPYFMAEKPVQALMAGSIPIYWGNPKISEYFNPKSMVNCQDYDTLDLVIDHIMEIENNPKLYHQYIEQPPILPNSKLFEISPEAILSRMDKIVERIRSNTPPPFHKQPADSDLPSNRILLFSQTSTKPKK